MLVTNSRWKVLLEGMSKVLGTSIFASKIIENKLNNHDVRRGGFHQSHRRSFDIGSISATPISLLLANLSVLSGH